MLKYTEISNQHESLQHKSIDKDLLDYNDDVDVTNDYEDDIKLFDLKKKLQTKTKFEVLEANSCRACGNEEGCVNLFEPYDENGLDLGSKLHIIGGIEVSSYIVYTMTLIYK